MRQPALPLFERPHRAPFDFSSMCQSRNRRRHTWPWRVFLLLLGFAVGWLMRGLIG
ncbi:MAG: hypothetical protein ABMA13_03010 [Chthoniobacteraceae bacterium]